MQLSVTLNQKYWFLAGDLDDCWVLSALMLVHAVAPWLTLTNVREFRAAAGDPDDGVSDGGNVTEIVKGIEGCYPVFRGKLTKIERGTWSAFMGYVNAGRPVSVGLLTGKLPARLQHQSTSVAHQVTVARPSTGGPVYLGDPLAKVYSRWANVLWKDIQDAILSYGALRSGGTRCVYAVAGPSELTMLPFHPLFRSASEGNVAALVEAGRKAGYNTAVADAGVIATDAATRIAALTLP